MSPVPATTPPEIHPSANVYRSEIGAGTKVAAFVEIGGAVIGERCKIQAFAFLCPGVVLEDDVFIGPHVCFTNDRHPRANGSWKRESTRICRGASIGAGSLILPGVTVGRNALVAAGSVVSTSVPEGYLYEGERDAARFKRWYARQEDVGLPMTFDEWRQRYDTLSCSDQVAFYDAVYEKFPDQKHGSLDEARRFFRSLGSQPISVLEVGGWDGRMAVALLDEFPHIRHWWNYELSRKAVDQGLRHPRYTPVVAGDFVWNVPDLPPCDVFFSAHCIEHIRASELGRLFGRLNSVGHVYLEAPLPASSTDYSWDGRWNTHILEIGWEQVEALASRYGFQVASSAPDVRSFHR